jgi:hypothetical protein
MLLKPSCTTFIYQFSIVLFDLLMVDCIIHYVLLYIIQIKKYYYLKNFIHTIIVTMYNTIII